MELFSMLAKLTLDASEFESKLKAAEQEASSFDMGDHTLDLDPSGFTEGIADAQEAADGFTPPDEDNNLNMDESNFTEGVDTAQDSADSFTPPEEDHELNLDATDFTDNLEDAQTEGISFGEIMGQVFENIKGALVTTGIVALVGQFVGFLKQGVALAGQNGDAIDKQSQKLHLSAEAYQEWNYALGLSGASVADLTRAMRNFDEIQGGKITDDQSKYFDQLGISATDAAGNMKSAQDLMEETLYALADYNGNDRGLITEAFFGRNSAGLNALLNSTSDEIKEMKQEANDLGLVMSDEDVKNAAAYMDATSRLQQAVDGLKASLGEQLLPFLTDAANTLAKIVAFFNPRTSQKTLSEMFGDEDGEFAEELLTIEGTAAAAETLADKLLSMGDTSKMTAEQYAIWKGTADELIKLVPTLGEVIDTETGKINANSEKIKENIKQWENLAKQKALQTLKEEKYQAIVEKNKDLIAQTVEANKKAGETEKARVESLSAINDILTKNGYEALGQNATLEDVFAAQTKVTTDNPYNAQLQVQLANAIGTWTSANQKAIEAQEEVNSLTAEVQKGEQEYQEWLETAESMYGTLEGDANSAITQVNSLNAALQSLPHAVRITIGGGEQVMSHAIGSAYIPYDNYPAILHRGEQVLTATEARQQNNIDLSGLEDRIAAAIRNGMEGTTVRTYLNGKDITDEVNRNNTNSVKAMRYRT